jgi:CheY-like chemotaxis protein
MPQAECLVLVVEDDVDSRQMIVTALESEGYHTVSAEHGDEALVVARQHQPNVILLDVMMPVMDGLSFRRAQLADPRIADIPVVLVSAHDGLADIAEALRVRGWLAKPLDLGQLLETIKPFCSAR